MSAGRWIIRLKSLWQRDGGKCHLCGLYVPWRRCHRDLRPSRDHDVPVSARPGDANTLENIRLAHTYCNSRKGNRTEVSQAERDGWANHLRVLLLDAQERRTA